MDVSITAAVAAAAVTAVIGAVVGAAFTRGRDRWLSVNEWNFEQFRECRSLYVDLLADIWDVEGVITAAAKSGGVFIANQERINTSADRAPQLHARLAVYAPEPVQTAARQVDAVVGPTLRPFLRVIYQRPVAPCPNLNRRKMSCRRRSTKTLSA